MNMNDIYNLIPFWGWWIIAVIAFIVTTLVSVHQYVKRRIKEAKNNHSAPVIIIRFDPPLDAGIKKAVEILNRAGIETYESCEGGSGHAYLEPTIAFHGERSEGFRALAIALQNGLPVDSLRRVWRVEDGEPTGPSWEITFYERV